MGVRADSETVAEISVNVCPNAGWRRQYSPYLQSALSSPQKRAAGDEHFKRAVTKQDVLCTYLSTDVTIATQSSAECVHVNASRVHVGLHGYSIYAFCVCVCVVRSKVCKRKNVLYKMLFLKKYIYLVLPHSHLI